VVGHSDTITYLEKKASPEVLQSMGITVGNLDTTQNTFALRVLQPEALFKKYRTKSKSAKKLKTS
jgi:non-specific serine/threonine protein kinase